MKNVIAPEKLSANHFSAYWRLFHECRENCCIRTLLLKTFFIFCPDCTYSRSPNNLQRKFTDLAQGPMALAIFRSTGISMMYIQHLS